MEQSKILVVTDTTSGWNEADAQKAGVALVALSVLLDDKEYKDQIEMRANELYAAQAEGKLPTTSQPNPGYLENCMKQWKEAHYDAIIVLPIAAGLLGTYQGFRFAAESLEMDEVHVIETRTLAAPLQDCACCAKKMAEANAPLETILNVLAEKLDDTMTYAIPKDLVQLKRGGRISPAAAAVAGLLKIKPLLKLAEDGSCVDKFGMARTETKLFQMICDDLKEHGVTPETHRLCIPHANSQEAAKRLAEAVRKQVGDFEISEMELPTVLGCHTGDGCLALQTIRKSEWD